MRPAVARRCGAWSAAARVVVRQADQRAPRISGPRPGRRARCASSRHQPAQLRRARPAMAVAGRAPASCERGSAARDALHRLAVHLPRRWCAAPRGAPRSRSSARRSAARSSSPAQPQRAWACGSALPRSPSCSRNHSRCCANDSGIGAVPVARGSIGGSAARARRLARAAREVAPAPGASNRSRERHLDAEHLRARARPPAPPAASARPASKKWSWRPTRSTPQQLGPDLRQRRLRLAHRRLVAARARTRRPRARGAPCGPPCRSA